MLCEERGLLMLLRSVLSLPLPLPSPLLLSFFSLSMAQFEKRLIARCGLVWAWVSLDASGETATERPGEVPDGVLYEGDLLAREEGADVQCYFDRSSLTLLCAFSPPCGARSLSRLFRKTGVIDSPLLPPLLFLLFLLLLFNPLSSTYLPNPPIAPTNPPTPRVKHLNPSRRCRRPQRRISGFVEG